MYLSLTSIVLFSLILQSASWRIPLSSPMRPGTSLLHSPTINSHKFSSNKQKLLNSQHVLHSSRCENYAEFLGRGNRWGGPVFGSIVRHINTIFIGLLFGFFLRIRNTFKSFRANILFDRIWSRPRQQGLLTVSNHKSFYDDPGLWAALLPWWRVFPHRLRWSLCTEDVFFAHPVITSILGAGNVVPLDRSGAIDQPLLQAFFNLLDRGQWCHVFAEGKVRQNWRFEAHEPKLGEFKLGVGKLIAHCRVTPIVIPIYHKGMDDVLPEIIPADRKTKKASKPVSFLPRKGQTVEMYFGNPIDFTDKIARFRQQHPGALDMWRTSSETLALYGEITEEVRQKVLLLEAEANGRESRITSNIIGPDITIDPSTRVTVPSSTDMSSNGPVIA